jgi:heat shock protein HslJ
LTGQVWELSLLNDNALLPGTSISIQFTAGGKLAGSSGCNQYSGTYTASGNTLQIGSDLASTMKACAQEIMDQESAYLKALGEVKTYSVTGDQLTLFDTKDKSILVYNARSQDLSGTSWEVIAYNNGKQAVTSVLAGSSITAKFGGDGTLSGNGGCNNYNGTYTVTAKQIKIGPLASTRMFCADPEGVMDQEALYLAALQTADTYKVEGTKLELRTKDGALAVQAAAAIPDTATSSDSMQNVVWQWLSVTNQSTGEVTNVPNPENYTITFNADGTFKGKADCNSFTGTYSQENGGIIITLGASTMAYCGDTSLDQQYLTLLGSVVAGGPDGAGGLALENAGGEQRMLFQNGGSATK